MHVTLAPLSPTWPPEFSASIEILSSRLPVFADSLLGAWSLPVVKEKDSDLPP